MTNPVLLELWRAGHLESKHRGSWVLVDKHGAVRQAVGDVTHPIFARSATKSLQALPFIESGAADAVGATPADIALAISSHSAEPAHIEVVASLLDRALVSADDLRCGPQRPTHPDVMHRQAERITNNCSGKHSAFLATARQLGDDLENYLNPHSNTQRAVRQAVADMTNTDPATLGDAVDGCSAPTFRMPLASLATGICKIANPKSLSDVRGEACRRIADAAATHPTLVGGTNKRIDTDLMAATAGRLFAKVGAEGVVAVAERDTDRAIAIKIDDGAVRGYNHVVVALLSHLGMLSNNEANSTELAPWADTVRRNWDGIEIGEFIVGATV